MKYYLTEKGRRFNTVPPQIKRRPPTRANPEGRHGAGAATGRFLSTATVRPTVPVPMVGPRPRPRS